MSTSAEPDVTTTPRGSTDLLVSVVITTYGRAHLLPRLIAALEAQTLDASRFEVVIIDDASPDETSAVLAELEVGSPLELRWRRARTNRGPAGGRNLGLRLARAPVVAFTDDDCVPEPQWLEAGLAAMDGSPRLVVGRTVPGGGEPAASTFPRVLQVHDVRYMQTCNVLYRRADLRALGGFDERLRAGEDTDLGLRAIGSGVEPIFEPQATVVHDVRPRGLRTALRETVRWVDLPLVVRRHPQLRATHLHLGLFWKRSHPPTLLAGAGLVLLARGRTVHGAVLLAPWLRTRLVTAPLTPGPRRRLLALPGALLIDLTEVATMLRGSVRHRTPVL